MGKTLAERMRDQAQRSKEMADIRKEREKRDNLQLEKDLLALGESEAGLRFLRLIYQKSSFGVSSLYVDKNGRVDIHATIYKEAAREMYYWIRQHMAPELRMLVERDERPTVGGKDDE